jgi:hypothetical protein
MGKPGKSNIVNSTMVDEITEVTEDKYDGERVFLIGNGPSLSKTPLDRLDSEYTIGVNKIYKKFDESTWRPDFYLLMHTSESFLEWDDKDTALRKINEMVSGGTCCILYSGLSDIVGEHPNITYLDSSSLKNTLFSSLTISEIEESDVNLLDEFWSDDIENFVYAYHSAYVMYQICSYLGFNKIILLGCDLGFEYKNPHMIFDKGLDPFKFTGGYIDYVQKSIDESVLFESIVNGFAFKLISTFNSSNRYIKFPPSKSNISHFTKGYWSKGRHIKDNKKLEREILQGHAAAKRLLSDRGVSVYNATLGGELELFPRVDLETIINLSSNGEV